MAAMPPSVLLVANSKRCRKIMLSMILIYRVGFAIEGMITV